MNKTRYIKNLNENLELNHISKDDIKDVVLDYSQMYDDALDRGLSDDETYQLLGDPSQVVDELKDTLNVKKGNINQRKFIALSPFISTIIFMIIGLSTDVWHPTWLIFLLIPISGIIFNPRNKGRFIALSPFISVIIFILVGTYLDAWNPGWLIFLLIPISGILYGK